MSKVFKRLLLQRLEIDAQLNEIIPNHQIGFRESDSTTQQTHRMVNEIIESLEHKKICTAAFFGIAQASWLLYKIKQTLWTDYYLILNSYLSDRINTETSSWHLIQAGVPQGRVLGPILYFIFTVDIPATDDTPIAMFTDDSALLASAENPRIASEPLQNHLTSLQLWTEKLRI